MVESEKRNHTASVHGWAMVRRDLLRNLADNIRKPAPADACEETKLPPKLGGYRVLSGVEVDSLQYCLNAVERSRGGELEAVEGRLRGVLDV